MHRTLIDQYEAQSTVLSRWIAGLSPAQLRSYPVPGTWSVAELVVHMLDSDLAAGHRMRRVAAEDTPLLIAYDETLFTRNLRYHETDLDLVAQTFDIHRRLHAQWLRTMPEETFARAGVHNHRGKVTLRQFVELYIGHVNHHEPFLIAKRKALGAPLPH